MRVLNFLAIASAGLAASSSSSSFVSARHDPNSIMREVKELSLYPPFIDTNYRPRFWDYGGDTLLDSFRGVRLTANLKYRSGFLWTQGQLPDDNWLVEVDLKVGGTSNFAGDGMVIWATTDRMRPGPVFGSMDFFNGLGLFMDTYPNGGNTGHKQLQGIPFPRIIGILGNGQKSYNHDTDGWEQRSGDCAAAFRDTIGITRLQISYQKGQFLQVMVSPPGDPNFKHCFSVEKVTLPSGLYLGFSAKTGEASDDHTVLGVVTSTLKDSTKSMGHISITGQTVGPQRDYGGSAVTFGGFLKFVIFVGIIGAAAYGYKRVTSTRKSRF
ncbi:hypothetical protein GQ42DRAFT_161999 [Ramicandelaber brevisporus]|nr:hypothetical protein GQ42DRAFT_161999 [Ramicandelaber brevisporus]